MSAAGPSWTTDLQYNEARHMRRNEPQLCKGALGKRHFTKPQFPRLSGL